MTNLRSADLLLERAIHAVCQSMVNEPDETKALASFHMMRELIRQRSPEQVRRLEKRKGKV